MTITATTTSNGAARAVTNTEAPEFTLWAPMFQINHRATDLESASSSAATSSQSDLPTTTLAESATNSPSGSSSASPVAQDGLSTGAIAGIAVGAAAGGILLAALLGCLWWRRARKRRQETAYLPSPSTAAWAGADGGDPGGYRTHNAEELPAKPEMYFTAPSEMDVPRPPVELPSESLSYQLDGRQIGTRHG